ncbi:ribonuclease H-like domain-containing protein [Nemania sp. FL0916]|nr:ribonuclease H-like domain-containing protein [Nemania sp. FL0916]
MAQELSSNWKKLQAKLKAESSAAVNSLSKEQSSPAPSKKKRKATEPAERSSAVKKPALQAPSSQASGRRDLLKKTIKQAGSSGKSNNMGATQSSAMLKGTPATVTPSLALWAEENDITAEDLAEAYNLGPKRSRPFTSTPVSSTDIVQDRRRVSEGLAPGIEVGKYIAVDCEMVGGEPSAGTLDMLARVSCVDFHGQQIYDSFVLPRSRVVDYRTPITGITASTLRSPNARPFDEVQGAVAELLKDRILVGHDVKHDLAVLELSHPQAQTRDTARHASFRRHGHGRKPALRVLAREVLGLDDFQNGRHSSVEDARVTMLLFRAKKSEFDVENASRYGTRYLDSSGNGGDAKDSKKTQAHQKRKKKKKNK